MRKHTIGVGELRQNPTAMLQDVAAGLSYVVERNGRPIAKVIPLSTDDTWTNNRAKVDEFLANHAHPDHSDWLAQIEADRRAETGADW